MNVIAQAIWTIGTWLAEKGFYQTIVKAALSYGLTTVANKQLARGSGAGSFQNEAARRLTTVRASVEPRRIVYGQMRMGGVLTYAETHGEDNKYLNMIITLAGHEIQAIDSVLWGDLTLTFSGSDGYATNAELQHPKGNESLLFLSKNLGADSQTADSDLTGLGLSWGANHRQRGCPNLYLRLHAEQERMNSIENVTAIVRGKKVYDPRTTTTYYSNNAALCVADYLMDTRYGFGIPLARIDSASLIAAANVCDESVTLNPSGTEPRYTINGSFDSSAPRGKTLQDMVNAMAGSVVWSGGKYYINAGAYTAPTITLTEDHLRGGLQIKTLESLSEATNRVRGIYANPDANYQIDDFPVVTNATYLSEDNGEEHWRDIELPFTTSYATAQRLAKIDLERSRQEITVQFPAQAHALQLKAGDTVAIDNTRMGWSGKVFDVLEIEIVDDDGYIGADLLLKETASTVYDWANGEETVVDPAPNTDLPDPTVVPAPTGLAVSSGTAELIAKASGTIISRAHLTWTRPASEFAGRIEVEYKKSILVNDGAMTAAGTTLTSAYPFFQATMVGKAITVPGAGVAAADLVTTVASFTSTTEIELTDAASTTVASADVYGEFWITLPWLPADTTEQYIADVWDGEDYDFRVRSRSVLGYTSNWATVSAHTIVGKTAAPSVPTGLAVAPGVNSIIVTWTSITDLDRDKTWVQWDTDPGFATPTHIVTTDDGHYVLENLTPGVLYYVRIRSQDTSRILSAYTAAASAQVLDSIIDIPSFSSYGKVGGGGDLYFSISGRNVYISGTRYVDSADVTHAVPSGSYVTTPLTNGSIYPVQTWSDGSELPGLDGAMYIAFIDTTADTVWPLAGMGGPGGEQFFVCLAQYSTGAWYVTDSDGERWSAANLSSLNTHIIAKIERERGYAGGITKVVSYLTGVIGNYIQSDNFVAGVSGWQLKLDTGDLEANEGTFRGTIDVTDTDLGASVATMNKDGNGGVVTIKNTLGINRILAGVDINDDGYLYVYDDGSSNNITLRADVGIDVSSVPIACRSGGVNGTTYSRIHVGTYGGDIRVNGVAGNARALLGVRSDDTGILTIYNDDNSVGGYFYTSANEGGRIDLYDDVGNFRAYFRVRDADGNTELVLRDSGGIADVFLQTGTYPQLYVQGGKFTYFSSADTDITALVPGSASGTLIQGPATAHVVVGIAGNDSDDGFYVIRDSLNSTGLGSYDEFLLGVNGSKGIYTEGFDFRVYDSAGTYADARLISDASSGGQLWIGNTGTDQTVVWTGGVRTLATFEVRTSLTAGNVLTDLSNNGSGYGRIRVFDNAGTSQLELHGDGVVMLKNLPTSDPSNTGQLWNDAGTLKVS